MKTRCFVWIAALLIVGSGVTYAYVSKELATLTPEEEFVTMYVYDSHSYVLKENTTNYLEHRLFRRTDVTRRHDSVLEFNEKHPMMTNNKKKKKAAESKSDTTGEVEPSDLLNF